MSTDKQIAANRLNAQKSTGPTTEAGKARVSKNARKLGLFVADTVLPQEDPQEFADILADYNAEYKPLTPIEHDLVNDLALASFKKRRYNRMETAVLWHKRPGDTRIEATRELHWHADSDSFKSILRAQAQAQRDFTRTYKLLEERGCRGRHPNDCPAEIQIQANMRHEMRPSAPKPVLQNKPNPPIEINNRQPQSAPESNPESPSPQSAGRPEGGEGASNLK